MSFIFADNSFMALIFLEQLWNSFLLCICSLEIPTNHYSPFRPFLHLAVILHCFLKCGWVKSFERICHTYEFTNTFGRFCFSLSSWTVPVTKWHILVISSQRILFKSNNIACLNLFLQPFEAVSLALWNGRLDTPIVYKAGKYCRTFGKHKKQSWEHLQHTGEVPTHFTREKSNAEKEEFQSSLLITPPRTLPALPPRGLPRAAGCKAAAVLNCGF